MVTNLGASMETYWPAVVRHAAEVSTVRYFNPTMRRRILAGDVPWWVEQHPRRDYIITVNVSTPDWVDRKELAALHAEAKRLTETSGVYHVLDHIVPVSHPDVCGLTVPWNLRVITWAQNASKGNKWHPQQMDLFAETVIQFAY